jgi:hypothetical protein
MSKRSFYCKWCYYSGFKLTASAKSTITCEKRTDVPDDFEYGRLCCWAKFLDYRKAEYLKLIICRATADIYTTFYKFHIANGKYVNKAYNYECGTDSNKETEETEDSNCSDEEDSNKEGAEETLKEIERKEKEMEQKEKKILKLARHKNKAGSMREMAQDLTKEAKMLATNAKSHNTIVCAIAGYGQNMDMPFFGSGQPSNTYYYMPKTVNNFGIVNVAPVNEILYTHVYCEDEGSKGGNNVTSLLHQYIDTKYGLDTTN